MSEAVTALLNYSQADEDGVMVLASRQAIHVVVDELKAAEAERDRLAERVKRLEEALRLALKAANLALFVIRKQNVMPNSSWEGGFEDDLRRARAELERK